MTASTSVGMPNMPLGLVVSCLLRFLFAYDVAYDVNHMIAKIMCCVGLCNRLTADHIHKSLLKNKTKKTMHVMTHVLTEDEEKCQLVCRLIQIAHTEQTRVPDSILTADIHELRHMLSSYYDQKQAKQLSEMQSQLIALGLHLFQTQVLK